MIDCETVRALALALPEVEEHDHWGRPSFRVRNKIFATLWPDEQRAVLKLSRADQSALAQLSPEIFSAVPGTWGEQGSTNVRLERIERGLFQQALYTAWCQVAPKRLIAAHAHATSAQQRD
ncbi:MAG TPA: MmcQ/YjbR family DNA-binding protein [Herpetosiphonaceae bacterium]